MTHTNKTTPPTNLSTGSRLTLGIKDPAPWRFTVEKLLHECNSRITLTKALASVLPASRANEIPRRLEDCLRFADEFSGHLIAPDRPRNLMFEGIPCLIEALGKDRLDLIPTACATIVRALYYSTEHTKDITNNYIIYQTIPQLLLGIPKGKMNLLEKVCLPLILKAKEKGCLSCNFVAKTLPALFAAAPEASTKELLEHGEACITLVSSYQFFHKFPIQWKMPALLGSSTKSKIVALARQHDAIASLIQDTERHRPTLCIEILPALFAAIKEEDIPQLKKLGSLCIDIYDRIFNALGDNPENVSMIHERSPRLIAKVVAGVTIYGSTEDTTCIDMCTAIVETVLKNRWDDSYFESNILIPFSNKSEDRSIHSLNVAVKEMEQELVLSKELLPQEDSKKPLDKDIAELRHFITSGKDSFVRSIPPLEVRIISLRTAEGDELFLSGGNIHDIRTFIPQIHAILSRFNHAAVVPEMELQLQCTLPVRKFRVIKDNLPVLQEKVADFISSCSPQSGESKAKITYDAAPGTVRIDFPPILVTAELFKATTSRDSRFAQSYLEIKKFLTSKRDMN